MHKGYPSLLLQQLEQAARDYQQFGASRNRKPQLRPELTNQVRPRRLTPAESEEEKVRQRELRHLMSGGGD